MTGRRKAEVNVGLRRLRMLYAVVFLVLITYIVFDGEPDNAATFGTLVGASIVVLGLEVGFKQIKVPGLSNEDPSPEAPKKAQGGADS